MTVYSGSLQAIFLKHDSCGRYPADVAEDETCLGACEVQWLTTYDPFTLVPSYQTQSAVSVPMGIVHADKRQAGSWYISVAAAAEGVVNYSLVAELVESPVIDQYIPLDADRAAAEKCGRFCVVLGALTADAEEDEGPALPSAAPAGRQRARAAASTVAAGLAAWALLARRGAR